MKCWNAIGLVALCLIWLGCGTTDSGSSEGGETPLQDVVDPVEPTDVFEAQDVALDIVEDVADATTDVEEDISEGPSYACPEAVVNPILVGEQVFYSCISTQEGVPYQEIRRLTKGSKTPTTLVSVEGGSRLGQTFQLGGGYLYYDTTLLEGQVVAARSLWRVEATGGDPELVRELTALDVAAFGDDGVFQDSSKTLNFKLQPGGTRIAFSMANQNTLEGEGQIYVHVDDIEELDVFEAPGEVAVSVSSFAWNLLGTQIAFVSGGNLFLGGADLSGAKSVDVAVFKTSAAPAYLSNGEILYAGTKSQLRLFTEASDGSAGKVPLGEPFQEAIEAIHRVSDTQVVVLAGELYWVDIVTEERVNLGPPPGQGLRHPMVVAPDGGGMLVGGSLDNPFRSFEYRWIQFEEESNLPSVGTEMGVGYVSTAVAWQ